MIVYIAILGIIVIILTILVVYLSLKKCSNPKCIMSNNKNTCNTNYPLIINQEPCDIDNYNPFLPTYLKLDEPKKVKNLFEEKDYLIGYPTFDYSYLTLTDNNYIKDINSLGIYNIPNNERIEVKNIGLIEDGLYKFIINIYNPEYVRLGYSITVFLNKMFKIEYIKSFNEKFNHPIIFHKKSLETGISETLFILFTGDNASSPYYYDNYLNLKKLEQICEIHVSVRKEYCLDIDKSYPITCGIFSPASKYSTYDFQYDQSTGFGNLLDEDSSYYYADTEFQYGQYDNKQIMEIVNSDNTINYNVIDNENLFKINNKRQKNSERILSSRNWCNINNEFGNKILVLKLDNGYWLKNNTYYERIQENNPPIKLTDYFSIEIIYSKLENNIINFTVNLLQNFYILLNGTIRIYIPKLYKILDIKKIENTYLDSTNGIKLMKDFDKNEEEYINFTVVDNDINKDMALQTPTKVPYTNVKKYIPILNIRATVNKEYDISNDFYYPITTGVFFLNDFIYIQAGIDITNKSGNELTQWFQSNKNAINSKILLWQNAQYHNKKVILDTDNIEILSDEEHYFYID